MRDRMNRRLDATMDAAGMDTLAALLADDHRLSACMPIDDVTGRDGAIAAWLAPLRTSFPTGRERTDILLGGTFRDGEWTASTGHLAGRFMASLFGIPATGRATFLRFGRFERWRDGCIAETLLILDLPGLMIQAGVWPLGRPLGPMLAPPPATLDGIVTDADPARAAGSLARVEAMIAGLMRYDGRDLASMGMADHWVPDFWWYGPAAIGSFQGFDDYYRGHSRPFLSAFPDRVGGNHRCRIGAGDYVASAGWPSIRATHSGPGFLGLPGTDRAITMRVMDVWRVAADRIEENWVFIDIPDLFRQLGVDLFRRMALVAGAA